MTAKVHGVAPCTGVVLGHGGWSNPSDRGWVAELLRNDDLAVLAADLPSHHGLRAGRDDDVRAVEELIDRAASPVVVASWSYGGAVVSDFEQSLPSVDHPVYVAWVPRPIALVAGDEPPELELDLSHILFPDDATCVLDEEWFRTERAGLSFSPEVQTHVQANPRRAMTINAFLSPPVGQAWAKVPTTIVLGRGDDLVPAPLQKWAQTHFPDVRVVEGNHFMPFIEPEIVAATIQEALGKSATI